MSLISKWKQLWDWVDGIIAREQTYDPTKSGEILYNPPGNDNSWQGQEGSQVSGQNPTTEQLKILTLIVAFYKDLTSGAVAQSGYWNFSKQNGGPITGNNQTDSLLVFGVIGFALWFIIKRIF